jgi:hypothetical protein
MIDQITEPIAYAVVKWILSEMGGRRSGPPTAPVYAATVVFVMGDDAEVLPGWPARAEKLSILLQEVESLCDGSRRCKVDFLARDLARPFLHPGVELLIMEGPKVVATAEITEVTDEKVAPGPVE